MCVHSFQLRLWQLFFEVHKGLATSTTTADFLFWGERKAEEHEQFKLMWNFVNDRMLGELMEAAIKDDNEDMYAAA
jgi:hypothetical protein